MSRLASNYLLHILDEIRYVLSSSENLSRESFLRDETLKRAFVRSLEIIGEATKNLSPDLTSEAPQIDWRAIAGMRDRLIHGYFGVDYEIVWDVIKSKLPELLTVIEDMIQDNGG